MMRRTAKRWLVSTLFLFAIFQLTNAQALGWLDKLKEIKPGVSRAQDVEKILEGANIGKSVAGPNGQRTRYLIKEGSLDVTYSTGDCTKAYRENCSVPIGTVIEALFEPDQKPAVSEIKLEPGKFESYSEVDNPTRHYMDKASGLDYAVGHGQIRYVRIFHPAIYDQIVRHIKYCG